MGKPGRYPLTTNMHVADLIRVAAVSSPARTQKAADLSEEFAWANETQLTGQQEQSRSP